MESSRRIVNLAYAVGAVIAYMVLDRFYGLVFSSVGIRDSQLLGRAFTTSTLLAAVTALALLFWAWRHPRLKPMAHEVADELVKVTWPTWDETKANTRVTVVVALVVTAILWVFDLVFGNLTNLILGGSA